MLELCDRGSLRDTLNKGSFKLAGSGLPDMAKVLETALDVARAMVHLHSENIVHSDLKARNVLLKSGGGEGSARDFVAKVADFGLSIKMEAGESHVSEVYQVGLGLRGGGFRGGAGRLPLARVLCAMGSKGSSRPRPRPCMRQTCPPVAAS